MPALRLLPIALMALFIAVLAGFACDDDGNGDNIGPPTCDDGILNGDEIGVDCGGSCDLCVVGFACNSGRDCRSRVCSYGTCAAPSCDDRVPNGNEADTDCGGSCPDRCPGGASCSLNSDCQSYICSSGTCVAPTCTDGERNGDETDVDCGGGACPSCPVGGICVFPDDCESRACTAGQCEDWACDDGIHNGDETDVDCGGPCDVCQAFFACQEDEDCRSRICSNWVCAASACDDEIHNGDESAVDCGGVCDPCDIGITCNTGADCITSYCAEGLCDYGASCFELAVSAGELLDGLYQVRLTPADDVVEVYCDMTTDGGGWTLVASTLDFTVNDEASGWYDDLSTLFPVSGHTGVWDGLRPVIDGLSDIRFSCKGDPAAEVMRVDLSFYATAWYREITNGTDAQSCFSEAEGWGYEQPAPARRDIVADTFLRRGNDWNTGFLEGEDSCDDDGDFTVDFDDRGMGGNANDGTDWGEADGFQKCGFNRLTIGSWFIWIREAAPHCVDGEVSEQETGADCGGVCAPCPDGQGCTVGGECVSNVCIGGICQRASCLDGVRNADETDVDCGGSCEPCSEGQRCLVPSDCLSMVCDGGLCGP